jgi:hypothetical protein
VVVDTPAAVVVVTPGAVDEVGALVAVAPAASEAVVVVEAAAIDDVVPAPLNEVDVEEPGPATLPPSMTPVSRSPM